MRQKLSLAGTKRAAVCCGALLAVFSAVGLFAYSTLQDNVGTLAAPQPVVTRWASLPVTWLMNSYTPNSNVSTAGCASGDPSSCIQQSLANGFATWAGAMVAGQSLTNLSVSYSGPSTVTSPNVTDCQNVIGFSDAASDFSTGTIAFTEVATVTASQYRCSDGSIKACSLPSCIADADIEFNPGENFSTSTSAPSGVFSLQSVATHEEGHLLGMDHSGIGHTVMFPFGDTSSAGEELSLSSDDAIGISFLYPCTTPSSGSSNCTASFSVATGKISGTVSQSGTGSFGAHVVAIDTSTGNVVIDGLTNPDGTYTLVGVPPGNYYILAVPLAPDDSSGIVTLGDFSGWDCGYGDSNCSNVPQNPTNYTGRYF
jgi:Matrixin